MFEFLAGGATPDGTYLEYCDALSGNAEKKIKFWPQVYGRSATFDERTYRLFYAGKFEIA